MNDERVDLSGPSALEMQHQQLAQLVSLQQEQLTVLQAQTREIVAALRDVQRSSRQSDVSINNVTMSFGDMVSLFVRSGLAAVPAMIILSIIGALVFAVLSGVLVACGAMAFR